MLTPRLYQQNAVDAALAFMRSTSEPGILELCTAAGKSVIVALIAHVVTKAGKRVLALGPNAEIATQNAEKYRMLGEYCSIFSASLGKRHTGHSVIFGTPLTVVNYLEQFGSDIALLIIDEAHLVSEEDQTTYQEIINHLLKQNPKLRILGLTATPMRMKEKLVGKNNTFKHKIFELSHNELSEMGYVVPFTLGVTNTHYELARIKTQSNGMFKQSDLDEATLGKDRLTKQIVEDVIRAMDADGRKCCMIFATSIKHAVEIYGYLPKGEAQVITGKTAKAERREILEQTRRGEWKFLVNVAALTTGVDLTCVDTVALLRATHSSSLLLQIFGRGCRLHDPSWKLPCGEMNWKHPEYRGKMDCLILDHGENLERFKLDDNLTITGLVESKENRDADDDEDFFIIDCPECGHGNRHTSQRCCGVTSEGTRCEYRYIYRTCESCETQNSPSARNCRKCGEELISPEKNLTRNPAIGAGIAFQVAVIDMTLKPHWKGESESLKVCYKVTDGDRTWEINEFLKPNMWSWNKWTQQTGCIATTVELAVKSAPALRVPTRLMVKKKKGSKYFDLVNRYYDSDSKNQLDEPMLKVG